MEEVVTRESTPRMPSTGRFTRRRRLLVLLSVIGPGLIAANADNDAGGIATLSVVGAHYGYQMLWALGLITFSLGVTQEMGARMGAVTGKGLGALIREQYRVRVTAFVMLTLLVANLGTTIAEFAGVAASMELLGVPPFLSVPIAAFIVGLLVIRGSYKLVERIFLILSAVYLSYVFSAFLAGPDWGGAFRSLASPTLSFQPDFLVTLIALVGTTITPWGQFFIQSYVVDKGISREEYRVTRWEVYTGAIITNGVSFFIIVCTAATIFAHSIRVDDASQAALALGPLAGPLAKQLFALGLLNASLLGAAIVPLSTAYAVCEAFGWEAGVNRSFNQAPWFNGLYIFIIAGGALAILLPGLPLVTVILLAQTVNGVTLPLILIFAVRLASNRSLMGAQAISGLENLLAWVTVVGLIAATAALVTTTVLFPALGINL